ncbi:MAG TPA: FYDLN acid domain-containing protein [Paracoccus sp. (in: a-proteobacteria)]|nr:FYDLN acid domain-containing protein [Paracoccus sp. (in: a-proteobacteria)]
MPKEEWGTKRLCPNCGARFYDLLRDPMTCPACAAEYTAESLTTARGRALISEKAAARELEQDDVIDEDLDDAADSTELDDDLLDDDDDTEVSLDEIADVAENDEE